MKFINIAQNKVVFNKINIERLAFLARDILSIDASEDKKVNLSKRNHGFSSNLLTYSQYSLRLLRLYCELLNKLKLRIHASVL